MKIERYVEETRMLMQDDLQGNIMLNEMMWLASSHTL